MASLTRWTWVWTSSRSWWWTGRLACCSPWGLKELDMTERLNWTFNAGDIGWTPGLGTKIPHWFMLRRVRFFVISWTAAHQAALSMRFSRRERCSVLPCPSPGDLGESGAKPKFLASPALAGRSFTTEPPGKPKTPHALGRLTDPLLS